MLAKQNPDGRLAFGVVYTLGDDPDGLSWLFTFSPDLASSELRQTYRWNIYIVSESRYLYEWTDARFWASAEIEGNDVIVD